MAEIKTTNTQTLIEERLNALTHGLGALLGIAALVLLVVFNTNKTEWSLFSVVVYGLSIIILFSSSTLYHSVQAKKQKHYFRIIDHISIYRSEERRVGKECRSGWCRCH